MMQPWIIAFMRVHCERFNPPDWPTEPDALARFAFDWSEAFGKIGATEAEAMAASRLLTTRPNPPEFRREHIPRVVAAVLAVRGPSGPPATLPTDPASDAQAEAAWRALDDVERHVWRDRVRARFPRLAHRPTFVESVAIAWHADPAKAEALPEPEPAPTGPRRPRMPGIPAAPNVYAVPDKTESSAF